MAINEKPVKKARRGPLAENEMAYGAAASVDPPSRVPSTRRAVSAIAALVLSVSAPVVSVGRTIEPPPAAGAASSPSHSTRSGIQLALLGDGIGDAALGADDDSNESESADGIEGGMVASADADDDEFGSEDGNDMADADGDDDGGQEMTGSDSDEDTAGADDEGDDEVADVGDDGDDGAEDDGMTGSDSDEDFDGGGED